VGLRVGTAVNPDLLGTNEKYTQITAEQFSSVTAENAMKWAEVEAVRGTYTWEKADQIVAFAKKNKQLVRGHTLVRPNQLPIHGVGFQGHLSTQYGYPDLTNNLERFAALGQKVALTEVDVRTQTKPDAVNEPVNALAPYAQESDWSRTLQACLAVRACISFTPWGFGDAYSWVPGWFTDPQQGAALIYDEQLNPKGQYDVLQQALALTSGAPRR
jgi:GH35 family endo-1,4-beta-xylanase